MAPLRYIFEITRILEIVPGFHHLGIHYTVYYTTLREFTFMNRLFLYIVIFLSAGCLTVSSALAASGTCCTTPTGQFAMLAGDPSFVLSHENPLPFEYNSPGGEWVRFKTPDDSTGRAFQIKARKETAVWIFVFQEWWGVNDYIRQEAEKLSTDFDANVLAIDLYDGQVATKAEDAQKLLQGVKDARAKAIIEGAYGYVGPQTRVGTIGWCFGGGWSFQCAIMGAKQVKACVMFYGMPEKDIDRLKALASPVLGIFATQDKWLTADVVKDFSANMKKAGRPLTVKRYDADHGFANPSSPKYNSGASKDAFKQAYAFLKKHLK